MEQPVIGNEPKRIVLKATSTPKPILIESRLTMGGCVEPAKPCAPEDAEIAASGANLVNKRTSHQDAAV